MVNQFLNEGGNKERSGRQREKGRRGGGELIG